MKTGFRVRVRRDYGGWEEADIAELTDTELQNYFEDLTHARLARWAKELAGWARNTSSAGNDSGVQR